MRNASDGFNMPMGESLPCRTERQRLRDILAATSACLPAICQFPQPNLSLSLLHAISIALAHSYSSSFRRRRCCRRCRSQKSRGKIETKTFGCQRRKRAKARRIKRIKRMCVVIWATNWSRHNSHAYTQRQASSLACLITHTPRCISSA